MIFSISMNPSRWRAEEHEVRPGAGEVGAGRASQSGSTTHDAVSTTTVTNSMPSTPTAVMLNWTMPWSCHLAVSNTSRSRSMWKKKGRSSVGAEMLQQDKSAIAAVEPGRIRQGGKSIVCREPRALHDLELHPRARRPRAYRDRRPTMGRASSEHGADAIGCVSAAGPRSHDGK